MNTVSIINNAQTMTSSELADLLGYDKCRVNQRIRDMFQSEIADTIIASALDNQGRVSEYHLPEVESNMFVARWDYTHMRKLATYWVNRKQQTVLPNFNNPAEAARAWADKVEAEHKAIIERDHAIATKALINDKRTATLMNKASQDSKKIKKLESKLQSVGSHKSLIAAGLPQRIDTEFKSNVQTWRVLKQISEKMGHDIVKVEDPRYGKANTYHIDVIDEFKSEYL